MSNFLRGLPAVAGVLFVLSACHAPTWGQEIMPNPALSLARSASSTNGGIESEWEYHRQAVRTGARPVIQPISRFAGGPGYCTPSTVAPYYGCDRSGCCNGAKPLCGCR